MEQRSIALIVPTFNAGHLWPVWLSAFNEQTLKPDELLIIDSSSDDATVELAIKYGFKVKKITKNEFNHGATRQLGVELCPNAEIYIFLTQDAILANSSALAHLVEVFDNPDVGSAYGRQIPHKNATPIAAHARTYNYPAKSRVKSAIDIPQLGIKTAFCSNSMAAYQRSALLRCGGFPRDTIVNEDMYVAGRMILSGFKVAYCAEAVVYHSHNYSYWEEFRRYFDQGTFHARNSWLQKAFGRTKSEGKLFVLSMFRSLGWRYSHYLPSAALRIMLNLIGYQLGSFENRLPTLLKRRLSMHSHFWN